MSGATHPKMDTHVLASGCAAADTDTSTDCPTVLTPSTTTIAERDVIKLESSVPQAGKVFILHDHKTGRVLTLLDGHVSLQPPGTPGSAYRWMCEEREGWLGFKNIASGTYLGHNFWGDVCAAAHQHMGWENFCVRIQPNGGYVLLMTHWAQLWPLKQKDEGGMQKLLKAEAPVKDGNVWVFVEV